MKDSAYHSVRVRFAPSPTGHLHIGSFRTALFNYLFARHHKGSFLLRIEDTDRERSKAEYTDSILASLAWVAIQPDEPMVTQSENIKRHQEVIEQLLTVGKAYRCYCSQDELKRRAGDHLFFKYDGACRSRIDQPDMPYVVRFKLPDVREISFDDLIRGCVTIPHDQLDDFIIARSDGTPMYNFVVVVDDADMRITHVIRGEDHISNTPKQILLYQACGFELPQFAHIPLILGPSGDRLSKRDGATSAISYKELGYLPDALVNYLVRLGWAHGDQEIFSRQELIDLFTLDAVGKKGAIFDLQKLNWLNGVYIRERSAQSLLTYIEKEIDPVFSTCFSGWNHAKTFQAIELYKGRVFTLQELIQEVALLYKGPSAYDEADMRKWITERTSGHLDQLLQILKTIPEFSSDALSQQIKELSKKLELKFAQLAQPIRMALIGKSSGPGLFDMLVLIGKKESIDRIAALRERI
jgi:glutamyl-tRNA synthetase